MLSPKNAERDLGAGKSPLVGDGGPRTALESTGVLRGATLLAAPRVPCQRVRVCRATIERPGLWREACSSSRHRGPHRSSTSGRLQWKAFFISWRRAVPGGIPVSASGGPATVAPPPRRCCLPDPRPSSQTLSFRLIGL
jgi:hypothetical protein